MTSAEPVLQIVPDRAPASAERRWHLQVLMGAAAVLAVAAALEVRAGGRVGPIGLPAVVAPETCLSKRLFGFDCPGCGLTRSFIHLAHGDLAASLRCNRVGWLLMAFVAAQIPYRLFRLARPGRDLFSPGVTIAIGAGIASLLLGNWVVGFWL